MRRRLPIVRLALGLVACGTAVALAATGSTAPPYGRAAVYRARAHRAAVRLLGELTLPPGAVRTSASHGLRTEGYDEATPNLVDAHAWFTIDRSPTEVIAWVAHHLPAGLERLDRGTEGGSGGVSVAFWGLTPTPGLTGRTVAVSVVETPSGATAVRLDGEAVWLTPRPAWERIPDTVAVAKVTGRGQTARGALGPGSRPVTLAAADTRRLAAFLNQLPAGQPGAISCPAAFDETTTIHFVGPTGRRLATAVESPTGCASVALRIGRRAGPTLQDGLGTRTVGDELVALGAIRPCRAAALGGSVIAPRGAQLVVNLENRGRLICDLRGSATLVLTRGARVLAGPARRPGTAGAPTILYPGATDSLYVSEAGCPHRPPATGARLTFAGERGTVPLTLPRPVHACSTRLSLAAVTDPIPGG